MTLMFVYCLDRPGTQDLRIATRPAHLEYMIAARDRLVFGGPLLSDDGTTIGSMFVLSADDRAQVEAFLADEPYVRAGLFEQVAIHPMVRMVPEAPPGRLDTELALARRRAAAMTASSAPGPGPLHP